MTTIGYLEVLVDRAAAGLPGELADPDSTARPGGSGARGGEDRQLTEAPDASASPRPDPAAAPSPRRGGRALTDWADAAPGEFTEAFGR